MKPAEKKSTSKNKPNRKHMIKCVSILIMITMISIQGYSQETQYTIEINSNKVDLDTVPLNNGIILEKGSAIRKNRWGETNSTYEIKLFTCWDKSTYAIVYDTISHSEGGYYNRIRFFSNQGNILFDRYYPGLVISSCNISSSGEIIVLELGSEDFSEVQIYARDGTIIARYENHYENYYIGENHNYFIKMKGSEENNRYDLIDKSGNISEIIFPNGRVSHIEFSKGELYYRVCIDKYQLLYNMNHELIWKIPLNFGLINFLNEGTSISRNRSTNTIEIRSILDQQVICSVSSLEYNGEKLGFFYYGLMDDHFYLVERVKGKWIFAFYNFNCEQVYYNFVNIRMTPSDYNVTKSGDKFDIIIKKERDY